MTLTIELTPDQEARFQTAVAASGSDPERVLQELFNLLPAPTPKPQQTSAETLA